MNWNDANRAWGAQAIPLLLPNEQRMRAFESDRMARERRRFWRDLGEAVTGVLIVSVMMMYAWRQKLGGLSFVMGIAGTLIPIFVLIGQRIRARHRRVRTEAPLLTRLRAEIDELRRQRDLWLGVTSWYIAPIGMSGMFFVMGAAKNLPGDFLASLWHDPLAMAWIVFFAAGSIFLLGWTRVRITRNLREHIEPRLAELEQWREELLSPPGASWSGRIDPPAKPPESRG